MNKSTAVQASVAFACAFMLLTAAALHAPIHAFLALGFLVFGIARMMQASDAGAYKLKSHLYGLGAWMVLVVALGYPVTLSYPTKERMGRTFVACLKVGMPNDCRKAVDDVYGMKAMSFLTSSIDWKGAVASCRAGNDFSLCLRELISANAAIGNVVSRADIDILCVGKQDKTACYLDLQKSGVIFRNIGITPEPAAKS